MTIGATLDVQQLEVLKGPQGTLFGENSTGGAINFISNKPSANFGAGVSVGYNNWGQVDASGYVTGRITDTLNARLALRVVNGGSWQTNVNQSGQMNGATDQVIGRLLTVWTPNDRLKVQVNLNFNINKSDNQAPQLQSFSGTAADDTFLNAAAPGGKVLFPAKTDQAAGWDPRWPLNSYEPFYQASVRADYDLTDKIALTSIISGQSKKVSRYLDEAGDGIPTLDDRVVGKIGSFNEELRVASNTDRLKWLVGANFEKADVSDADQFNLIDYPGNDPLGPSVPAFHLVQSSVKSDTITYAAFANAEAKITNNLSAQLGLRGTQSDMTAGNCNTGDAGDVALYTFLGTVVIHPPHPVGAVPGQCDEINSKTGLQAIQPYNQTLNEGNVSGRAGPKYKFDNGILAYVNYSRGFKSGIITDLAASVTNQFQPARQEKVDAWEGGFKGRFFDRRLEVNGAGFYYDYTDKQVRLRFPDPVFALLETVVNIPKSEVLGGEIDVTAKPVDGLTITANGTYLHSEVTSDFSAANGTPVYNQAGQTGNFTGAQLPYTPEWSGLIDAQYDWSFNRFIPFLGGDVNYTSTSTANLATNNPIAAASTSSSAAAYKLNAHALLDLRAGIRDENDKMGFDVLRTQCTKQILLDERVRFELYPIPIYRVAGDVRVDV